MDIKGSVTLDTRQLTKFETLDSDKYSLQAKGEHYDMPIPKRTRSEGQRKEFDVSNCWFCLGNPASRKHLIISIGDLVYLALARGGLTNEHFIIVPIEHLSGTTSPSVEVYKEIDFYKGRMSKLFMERYPIYFILRQSEAHHWHMQCITIPKSKIDSFEPFICAYFKEAGFELSKETLRSNTFFEMQIGDRSLYYSIENNEFFPAQIGRQSLAEFLNIRESKEGWRNSTLSEVEEIRIVNSLKAAL